MNAPVILGDWGSTRLRLWRMDGTSVADRIDGPGMVALAANPRETLEQLLTPWITEAGPLRVILCGMAGARGGLAEVPYAECPADRAGWRKLARKTAMPGLDITIAAGVACRAANNRHDVMRGEETQVFGALALRPKLEAGRHDMVLPGTHSKWISLDDGRITGLRTFLTGELFAALQGTSLLAAGGEDVPGDEPVGIESGLSMAQNGGLLGNLFHARAAQLRDGKSATWARGYLSGLLLGSEVAEMGKDRALPARVTVIGDARLARRYESALAGFGVVVDPLDGETCAIAGLGLLHADT